jgi:hypothetical protein
MAPSVDKWPFDRKELGSVSVWETEPIILWAQTHIATLDHFFAAQSVWSGSFHCSGGTNWRLH